MSVIAIVDTETTGIEKPALTQLGWALLDTETGYITQHSVYTNPGKPIEPDAQAITGIYDDMLTEAAPVTVAMNHLRACLDAHQVTQVGAHNADFDMPLLAPYGVLEDRETFCTVRLAKHLLQDLASYKLQSLLIQLRIPYAAGGFHDAGMDCYYTACLLKKLRAEMAQKKMTVSLAALNKEPVYVTKLRFGKHTGKTLAELKGTEKGYLTWLLGAKQKEVFEKQQKQEPCQNDLDLIYSIKRVLKGDAERHRDRQLTLPGSGSRKGR